jgi:multidrug transporter EmrE-like cation transporter
MVGLGGAIAALLASGVFQALGEYLSKLWGITPSWSMAALAVAAYAVSSLIWLPALLYRNQLSTIGIAWDLIAVATTLILGLIVFHETLAGRQIVGIVLAIVALCLLLS